MNTGKYYPTSSTELGHDDWEDLAKIFSLAPSDRRLIEDLIKHLPARLKRHWSWKLVPNRLAQAKPAVLCSVHKGLNPYIVSSIFNLLADEVEDNMDILVDYPRYDKVTSLRTRWFVRQVRKMNGMWLNDTELQRHSPDILPSSFRSFQENGCKACILSRVGNDGRSLYVLRNVLRSRRRPNGQVPRLCRFVNKCIQHQRDPQSLLKDDVPDDLARLQKNARDHEHRYGPPDGRSRTHSHQV